MKRILLFSLLLGWLHGCGQAEQEAKMQPTVFDQATRLAEVVEVIEVEAYTYLRIDEHGKSQWIATSPVWVQQGDFIAFHGGVLMQDFTSSELNRTFDFVLFVEDIEVVERDAAKQQLTRNLLDIGKIGATQDQATNNAETIPVIDPIEGGMTIASIYTGEPNKTGEGDIVRIRARVEKISANILKRNWVTVADGTGAAPDNKLVVTTLETPEVGAIYTIEGRLLYDQYVGPGYTYKVLITDATFKE